MLFSAPMVRAILAGQKTVTRRVVKFPVSMVTRGIRHDLICYTPGGPRWREYEAQLAAKDPEAYGFAAWPPGLCVSCNDETCQHLPCPYGAAGDRLWVRETWSPDHRHVYPCWSIVYRADGYVDEPVECRCDYDEKRRGLTSADCLKCAGFKWRPSIFMPRGASRLSLDVGSVRVERLHDITDAEATLEGVRPLWLQDGEAGCWYTGDPSRGATMHARTPRGAFEKLWVAINGRESWDANPLVWRVEFAKDAR